MASSTIVHAAVFAVGALVGGGVATAVASRSRVPPPSSSVPVPAPVQRPAALPVPMLDTKEGVLVRPPAGAMVQVENAVLKYGHPGAGLSSGLWAGRS